MHTVGEEGHLMYPLKDFGKLGHTNAINNKSRRPLDFLTTPSTPSKEFENDCASKYEWQATPIQPTTR
jgi:hypothetical protein